MNVHVPWPAADSRLEVWTWRLLLGTVFGTAFSIALGQTLGFPCLILFVAAAASRRVRWVIPPVFWPAFIFSLIALLSVHLGPEPTGALKKTGRLVWFLLIPITASLARTPARRMALLRALAGGAGLLAVKIILWNPWKAWQAFQADGGLGLTLFERVVDKGSMTAGQVLMMGVLVAAALLGHAVRCRAPQGRWWTLLVVSVAGLLLNFKRGSWLVTLLLGAAGLIAKRRWVWLALLVTGVGLGLCCHPLRYRMEQLSRESDIQGGGRLTMWVKIAPALVRQYPLGVGYRSVTPAMLRRVAPYVERHRNHLHSNIAQVLVETGWAGLLVYLMWMIQAVLEATRRNRAAAPGSTASCVALALTWMLAGLLLNGLVEYNFGDTELMILLAVILGAQGARPAPEAEAA